MGATTGEMRGPLLRERNGGDRSHGTRTSLSQNVARIFVDRPVDELNMQAIARLTGASIWALRYHFGTMAGLFRAAVMHVVDVVERGLAFSQPPQDSVIDTIRCYGRSLRSVVSSGEYKDLLFLVLRHGNANSWVHEVYDRRIVGKICADLTDLVMEAGERLHAPVLFKDGVTRRFHRRIETEFALRNLLTPGDALSEAELDALLAGIVREAFAGTYCFDWRATNAA